MDFRLLLYFNTIEDTKLRKEEESFRESGCPLYIHCLLAPIATLASRLVADVKPLYRRLR
jgi:hypothetical protein